MDGNGTIEFEEFSKMMLTKFEDMEKQERKLRNAFEVL